MLRGKGKGITLVALVITIVILIILAGISISTLTNTGIFQKVQDSKKVTKNTEKEQRKTLDEYEKELNKYVALELTDDKINKVLNKTQNTVLKDVNGNIFTLPAGFKVVVNEDTENSKTVDKGIVIEDATVNSDGNPTATNGSQFVWVPVDEVTKLDGTKELIKLDRYDFNMENGNESEYSGEYIEEDINDETTIKKYGNSIARNLEEFKVSVNKNRGYYIGRYEARTVTQRKRGDELTQITEIGSNNIYNFVTQAQASELSKEMYDSELPFSSDLINSYAWDTAITFIQKCTDKKRYSYQTSINDYLLQTGTVGQAIEDKECNIYDMASNIVEYTTETAPKQDKPCGYRGGIINNNNCIASGRGDYALDTNHDGLGFRPILFIMD